MKTGKYRISFYTKYGGRVRDLEIKAISLTKAKEKARKIRAKKKKVTSFAVDRRVYNSLD